MVFSTYPKSLLLRSRVTEVWPQRKVWSKRWVHLTPHVINEGRGRGDGRGLAAGWDGSAARVGESRYACVA